MIEIIIQVRVGRTSFAFNNRLKKIGNYIIGSALPEGDFSLTCKKV